jgi:hypothetical protein
MFEGIASRHRMAGRWFRSVPVSRKRHTSTTSIEGCGSR